MFFKRALPTTSHTPTWGGNLYKIQMYQLKTEKPFWFLHTMIKSCLHGYIDPGELQMNTYQTQSIVMFLLSAGILFSNKGFKGLF